MLLLLVSILVIGENPLVEIKQLEPGSSLKTSLVVPLAEVLKLYPVDILCLPIRHDVRRNRLRRIGNILSNGVSAQAQTLVATREHDDQEGAEEEKEIERQARIQSLHKGFLDHYERIKNTRPLERGDAVRLMLQHGEAVSTLPEKKEELIALITHKE